MPNYHFINNYRLQTITADNECPLNWLFLPGGPGVGSEYIVEFVKKLKLPGNVHVADFPGDGSNRNTADINYDSWKAGLLEVVASLKPCILVTHSFSGMFALTIPEIEDLISGLVIINSAPDYGWIQELEKTKEKHNLPDLSDAVSQFYSNPTDAELKIFFEANIPYLFADHEVNEGRKLLDAASANATTKLWVDQNFHLTYKHNWCPKQLPTIIIGSHDDRLLPMRLFLDQEEWVRDNIQIVQLESTGHFPFLSCLELIDDTLCSFGNQVMVECCI